MKIGILTFHRAHNYGAMLQAVALRSFLSQKGDAYFIDYRSDIHEAEYRIFNKYYFKKNSFVVRLNYIRKFLRDYTSKKRRIQIFNSFYNQYILPYSISGDGEHFDYIFYGSDQIWRKRVEEGEDFDPVYFGNHTFHTNHHIAYAASMGILRDTPDDLKFLTTSLSKFDAIGVREENLKDLLIKTGLKDISINIDPTLLLNKEEWSNLLNLPSHDSKRERYILFYDLLRGSFDLDAVKKFANEKNLKLKILKGVVDDIDYGVETIEAAGPRELVELIANADFIFTSSFHGLAFSLIFEKPFFASYSSNSGRASTILNSLQLSDRLLSPLTPEIPALPAPDYSVINERMKELRKESEEYITKSIDDNFSTGGCIV